MAVRVKVSLFKCGRCHKSYNNRLTHVCRVAFTKSSARRVAANQKKTR